MISDFGGLEELLVPQVGRTAPKRKRSPEDGWVAGPYIAGKMPLDWVCRACKVVASARTHATIWAIWYKRGLEGRDEDLKLTTAALKRFGVDRSAKSRALAELEELGLIRVTRPPRKNPLVTIIRNVPAMTEEPPSQAA